MENGEIDFRKSGKGAFLLGSADQKTKALGLKIETQTLQIPKMEKMLCLLKTCTLCQKVVLEFVVPLLSPDFPWCFL